MIIALVASMLAGAAAALSAQQPPLDLDAIGPKIGATVPAFTLPDQLGRQRSLDSLMGPKGAVLVFFRSADW
jgi:cytochrome oxidase Cu insertion factor (SCO1/SenC/PrrC family)